MWYEWFFDGLGTEIVILILGIIIGGFSGYKIGIKRNGMQKQKGKSFAKQNQQIDIEVLKNGKGDGIDDNLRQVQKAGKNSEQSQIGRIKG